MVRKPQEKAAIAILKNAFAAEGVKLGHTKALHLLAQLEGHKGHKQAKSAVSQEAAPGLNVSTRDDGAPVPPFQYTVIGHGGGWDQVFVDVVFEVEYPVDERCRALFEAGDIAALLCHVADHIFVDVEYESEKARTEPGYANHIIEKFVRVEDLTPNFDALFDEDNAIAVFQGTIRTLVCKDKTIDGAVALERGGDLEGFMTGSLRPLSFTWLSAKNVV
jgi:hypothetical protein